jgi:shikimate kinase
MLTFIFGLAGEVCPWIDCCIFCYFKPWVEKKPTAFLFCEIAEVSQSGLLTGGSEVSNNNIVLVGYRCSGKTSVGKHLARELGRKFFDTDAWIEKKAQCSIETIVSRHGWECFRTIEKALIKELSTGIELVIATGGGVVMDEENIRNLKKRGFIVWLNAKAEVLKKRMVRDQRSGKLRPSLTGSDPLEEIMKVLNDRTSYYQKASDFVVDTSSLFPREVAALIIKKLPRLSGDRKT